MNYYTLEKVIKQETEHITHKYNSAKWLNNFKFSYVEVSTGAVQYVQKYTVSICILCWHTTEKCQHGERWGLPRTMVCHMSTRDERFTYHGRQYGTVWY